MIYSITATGHTTQVRFLGADSTHTRPRVEGDTQMSNNKPEFFVSSNIFSLDVGGYEYEVKLVNKDTGSVIDEWSSLRECYQGGGHLTEENAKATVQQIKDDVNNGKVDEWFDVPKPYTR